MSKALKAKGITFRGLVPSYNDIARVKRAKDLEKELDGMDASNIIANRRTRRAASRVKSYRYDDDDFIVGSDEENDDSDAKSESDAESEASSAESYRS